MSHNTHNRGVMVPKLMSNYRKRCIQLAGMGLFFALAAVRLKGNDFIHPTHSRRRLNSNGTQDCQAKMAAFYGDQCAEPYCEDLVGGFVNYFKMHTCDLAAAPGLSYTILVGWLLVVFWLLADTADSFFVPILQQIVVLFSVQPALAGITFLAFGNGAPDVFATIASFAAGGNAADIGIGSLLGSGMFVTTVVLALVAFQSDGRLKRRPFMRDIICYLLTLSWLMYIVYSEECTFWQAQIFVGLYIAFLLFVVGSRRVYLKYYKVYDSSGGGSGSGSLDAALLTDDEMQMAAPAGAGEGSEGDDTDSENGNLWGWDGGLRLKLRAKRRASTHNQHKLSGRTRGGHQSLTAAEYRKRLSVGSAGGIEFPASRRVRAASHNLDGSDNHDLLHAIDHAIDHAGGWAGAASKVDHHTHMVDECTDEDCTEPSVSMVATGMVSSAIEAFQEESLWGKLVFIICAPLTLARRLSIPVLGNDFFDDEEEHEDVGNGGGHSDGSANSGYATGEEEQEAEESVKADDDAEDDDEDGYAWSKPFACASLVFLPTMFGVGTIESVDIGPLPVWVLCVLGGVAGAVLMGLNTSHNHPPRSRNTAILMLVLGFAASILWIYFIANELVTVLQVLGILLGIPNR